MSSRGRRLLAERGFAGAGEDAGQEPVAVTHDDITAATTDGVLVYLGAAKAGGYALVVGGTFDPSYLELPRLDRASVENLRERCLPSFGQSLDMDVDSEGEPPRPDELDQALRTLWDDGIRGVRQARVQRRQRRLAFEHQRRHALIVAASRPCTPDPPSPTAPRRSGGGAQPREARTRGGTS